VAPTRTRDDAESMPAHPAHARPEILPQMLVSDGLFVQWAAVASQVQDSEALNTGVSGTRRPGGAWAAGTRPGEVVSWRWPELV
jgi:hypothetical protein